MELWVTLHHLALMNGRWGRFRVARERPATDASGAYRFADLEDGYYIVSAEKEGFARVLRPAGIQEGASREADIVLKPPASLVIHVQDRDGKPVARLTQVAHLVVLDALQPVAEGGADGAIDRVGEETFTVEERAHFDAELPEADGNA